MLLAGLRDFGPLVEQEAKQMPILGDIMDHPVLGRERRTGREQGLEQGERKIVLRQIAKRFGPMPAAALKCIEALPVSKLERIALRPLDASSLGDLLD
jgi:hypothetical protein